MSIVRSPISQVQLKCASATYAVYSGDLHNMTRIATHHIGHGSSLVTIATLLSMKESCSTIQHLHSQSYHRVLLGSSGGMSVLHLMILHPISATASNTESAMSSLAAPFRMRSVS